MGKLERLAAARERVKKWKALHPKSVEWQRKRWYARKKGERKADMIAAVVKIKELPREYPRYGELHTGWIEGVDVGYAEMEPKAYGGPRVASQVSHGVAWDERERTAEEERVAEQLAAFKARRGGVQVELIL